MPDPERQTIPASIVQLRAAWKESRLTASPELLEHIVGHPVASIEAAIETDDRTELLWVLHYGRTGRIEATVPGMAGETEA